MTHSPKGGTYVTDHLAGQETFYPGGQFLPETTPPLQRKAQTKAKKYLVQSLPNYITLEQVTGITVDKANSTVFIQYDDGLAEGTHALGKVKLVTEWAINAASAIKCDLTFIN